MIYIDADKILAEIKRYKNKADNRLKIKGRTFSEEQKDLALQNLCGNLLYFIASLQQEQPKVDLENKFGWHNISEEIPEFGDTVIVACKNKNKEDGIWLYDLIHCWEGKWEPRENWEAPLKWISVDKLGLNARKEK